MAWLGSHRRGEVLGLVFFQKKTKNSKNCGSSFPTLDNVKMDMSVSSLLPLIYCMIRGLRADMISVHSSVFMYFIFGSCSRSGSYLKPMSIHNAAGINRFSYILSSSRLAVVASSTWKQHIIHTHASDMNRDSCTLFCSARDWQRLRVLPESHE